MATNVEVPSAPVKLVMRDRSPSPRAITQRPTPITMASAVISMSVSTTLNFTLSPTPRRLIAASSAMNSRATTIAAVSDVGIDMMPSPASSRVVSRPASRLAPTRVEDVDALVMPEQTTANATRNVTKWMPKALCV